MRDLCEVEAATDGERAKPIGPVAEALRLIRAGLDPVTVASVLGHEDATSTLLVYAHLFDRLRTDEAVREALAAV